MSPEIKAALEAAKAALEAQDVWHKEYDDVDGYAGSVLEDENTKALALINAVLAK